MTRSPRALRPNRRVMFVVVQVSSRKTSLAGSSSGCCLAHSARAAATSGRVCSAACSAFFERQPQTGQRRPRACKADRDAVFPNHPGAQLGDRRVRLLFDSRPDRRVLLLGELARRMRTLRSSRSLPRAMKPLPSLDHIGRAHLKLIRYIADGKAIRNPSQHTVAQILRIRPPPAPTHHRLRFHTGGLRITGHPRAGRQKTRFQSGQLRSSPCKLFGCFQTARHCLDDLGEFAKWRQRTLTAESVSKFMFF